MDPVQKSQISELPSESGEKRKQVPTSPPVSQNVEVAADTSAEAQKKQKEEMHAVSQELRRREVKQALSFEQPIPSEWQSLATRISDCLRVPMNRIENIFKENSLTYALESFHIVCDLLVQERLAAAQPITEKEIIDVYKIYFETNLKTIFSLQTSKIEYVNPPPALIFHSLFQCLTAMKDEKCSELLQRCKQYTNTAPKAQSEILRIVGMPALAKDAALKELQQKNPILYNAYMDFETACRVFREGYQKIALMPIDELKPNTLPGIRSHANEVWILKNPEGKPQWVMKTKPPNIPGALSLDIPRSEHTASLVNYHHRFNVPCTLLVNLHGIECSLQFYISDTIKLKDVRLLNEDKLIKNEDLQIMLLFDLLFGNCDRQGDNFLFKKEGNIYRVYLIDHDYCFTQKNERTSRRGLTTKYLELLEKQTFSLDLLTELSSSETLAIYKKRLNVHHREDAIKWVDTAAQLITANQTKPIEDIVALITDQYGRT